METAPAKSQHAATSDFVGGSQRGYRGRVRSGCLTCRTRKVKCDESRPVCHNCTRLKRGCIYKPRKSRPDFCSQSSPRNSATITSSQDSGHELWRPETGSIPSKQMTPPRYTASASPSYPTPLSEEEEERANKELVSISPGILQDPFLTPDASIVDVTSRLERALRHQNAASVAPGSIEVNSTTPSSLISRDIELTTTMDILAAREVSSESFFSFFLETVECPSITLYDSSNWQRMKYEIVELGKSRASVASAIIAVSLLYKGQLYNLPLSRAISFYHSALGDYDQLLCDTDQDVGTVLVATFLLCLFEFIHYETVPILKRLPERFYERLKAWEWPNGPDSQLSKRIITWLTLLQTSTMRGGGNGLFTDRLYNVITELHATNPSFTSPLGYPSDTSTQLYDVLVSPIFEFYFQLQVISGEIAKLTHYRRSRNTGDDQEQVVREISNIKSRLYTLWESRSAAQRQTPEDLRSHLAPRISEPIITLVGVCAAAYHVEFVEIGRVLGDPVSESTESKQSMRRIRKIIDGDWNIYEGGKLSAGYLRPLFIYAIECMDRNESQWAVEKMGEIQNPICRSDFFAAFGKALSDAQLRKERRITSKYFCVRYFGVPPPYM